MSISEKTNSLILERIEKLLLASRDAIPIIDRPRDHSVIDFNGHYFSFDEFKRELLRMCDNKEAVKGRLIKGVNC